MSIPWYQSKTVWWNAVMTLLLILPPIGTFLKIIMPDVAVMIDGVLALVDGVGNVILRVWFTDKPIRT